MLKDDAELKKLLAGVWDRVLELAVSDERLRRGVHDVAARVAELTKEPEKAAVAEVAAEVKKTGPVARMLVPEKVKLKGPTMVYEAGEERITAEEAVAKLDIGARASRDFENTATAMMQSGELRRRTWPDVPDTELDAIEKRCRLKARAVRSRGDEEATALLRAELEKQGEPRPWVLGEFKSADPATLAAAAGTFEVLADAVELVKVAMTGEDRDEIATAFQALAEAQNALRVCAEEVGGGGGAEDADQTRVFHWLRGQTEAKRILVSMYMRMSDRADWHAFDERRRRIEAQATPLRQRRDRDRRVNKGMGKVKYLVGKIARDPADLEQWHQLEAVVAALLEDVRAKDVELVGLVRRVAELVPKEAWQWGAGLGAVLAHALPAASPREAGTAAEGAGGPTLEEVVNAEVPKHPSLVLALNSRSELQDNPFEDVESVRKALEFLGTIYADARAGRKSCPDLPGECKRACGFEYAPHQSETTMGMYANYYQTTWEGRAYTLSAHLGTGNNKDPRYTLRLAFAWDEQREKIIIGYVGQHQRTRAT